MRGSRRRIVAFAATMALVLPLWAGGGTAQGGVPSHPTRVLIVLFDQMIPQYANQFDMPNFRELRNEGTNFRNAYLGYMALGDGDRPQRDHVRSAPEAHGLDR